MKKNNKGFSLVELIIVIAIMAILAGALAPALIKYINKSKRSTDIQNADSLRTACQTALANPDAQDCAAVINGSFDATTKIVAGSNDAFYKEVYSIVGNATLVTKYKCSGSGNGKANVGTHFYVAIDLANNTVKVTAGANGPELSPVASGDWAK